MYIWINWTELRSVYSLMYMLINWTYVGSMCRLKGRFTQWTEWRVYCTFGSTEVSWVQCTSSVYRLSVGAQWDMYKVQWVECSVLTAHCLVCIVLFIVQSGVGCVVHCTVFCRVCSEMRVWYLSSEVGRGKIWGLQHHAWLYCTVLYCTVLYCIVLYYCTVLYCTVLHSTAL